jgi:hypothetical protein
MKRPTSATSVAGFDDPFHLRAQKFAQYQASGSRQYECDAARRFVVRLALTPSEVMELYKLSLCVVVRFVAMSSVPILWLYAPSQCSHAAPTAP